MDHKGLKNILKKLEKENKNLNSNLENSNIIYKHSSNYNSTLQVEIFYCKDCKSFKNKVEFLEKTLTKFTMEKSNLNTLLNSQTCVMDKAKIGYSLSKKQKSFKRFSFHPKMLFTIASIV